MTKKSFVWLTMMLCMLLPLVAACGSGSPTSTSTGPTTTVTPPVGENIYVLDGYAPQSVTNANQHIIAFHPGVHSHPARKYFRQLAASPS